MQQGEVGQCWVIIPCFNEAERLLAGTFLQWVQADARFALLFVDDGSTDATAEVLSSLAASHERIRWMALPSNSGKASAIRAGIHEALEKGRAETLAFLDADLAIPPEELVRLLAEMESQPHCRFAFLSKWPASRGGVKQRMKRFAMGRMLALANRTLFGFRVYDTQCGCKLFRREVAEVVFREPFLSAWLFDIEIFCRLVNEYGRSFLEDHAREVPLRILHERGSSRVNGRALLRLPGELLAIRTHYGKG